MKPTPAIPESARRHYVKGSTLYDDSKNPSESADASEEFRQSLLIAPWWGDAYMKMGLALESSKRYDEAIAALKLFIATNPKDDVMRKAQDEIYKIEARAQKAAKPPKHSAPEVKTETMYLLAFGGSRFSFSRFSDEKFHDRREFFSPRHTQLGIITS